MLFVIRCIDAAGAHGIRQANRAAHLEYLRALGEDLRLAGPLLSEDGETMVGSLLVVNREDRALAEAFAEGDPYRRAGLFQDVTIHRFKHVLP